MTTTSRSVPLRGVAACVTLALAVAACSTGESAIDAGRDDTVATEPAPPGDDTTQDTSGDTTAATDATDEATVASAPEDGVDPTTPTDTAAPTEAASLPTCPADALASADAPVEITMWFGLGEALGGDLQDLVDRYNDSQDSVVVSIENQIDYESTIDSYQQLGVDERPELLLAPEFVVQTFAESDTFVPVESCIDATELDTSAFLPRALNAYNFGGAQWALPFNVSSPVLFYVIPRFEQAGLDPADPPFTPEELRVASEALVESDAAAYGLVVDVARDSAGGFVEQWFGQAEEPFVDNDNGRSARATQVFVDSETGIEVVEFLRDLRRDGLSFNVGENSGGLDAFLKLVDPSEPGAMRIDTSAALTQLFDALDGGLGGDLTRADLGVGPLPGPGDSPAAQVSGASLWLPAGKTDAEIAAAWDFSQFLVGAQVQSDWAAATGYVPMRSDAIELDPIAALFDEDPRFRVAYDQLAAPTDSPFSARPALGPQREVRQEIADALARVYADPEGVDVDALLADVADTSNRLISNYNDLN